MDENITPQSARARLEHIQLSYRVYPDAYVKSVEMEELTEALIDALHAERAKSESYANLIFDMIELLDPYLYALKGTQSIHDLVTMTMTRCRSLGGELGGMTESASAGNAPPSGQEDLWVNEPRIVEGLTRTQGP